MRRVIALCAAAVLAVGAGCSSAPAKPDDCKPADGRLADLYISDPAAAGFDEAAVLERGTWKLIGGRAGRDVAAWALSSDGVALSLDSRAAALSGEPLATGQVSQADIDAIHACVS